MLYIICSWLGLTTNYHDIYHIYQEVLHVSVLVSWQSDKETGKFT